VPVLVLAPFSAAWVSDEGRRETAAAIGRVVRCGMDEGAFRLVDPHATIVFAVLHGAADAIAAGEQPQRWRAARPSLARGHTSQVTGRLLTP
jgi:hypothetical protein